MDIKIMEAQVAIEDYIEAVVVMLSTMGYENDIVSNFASVLHITKTSHIAGLVVTQQVEELVKRMKAQDEGIGDLG